MRVFLLILIAIVVGSAAGSMASWFLLDTPQPLAVANANENTPVPVATNVALAVPANDEEREAREAILREAEARSTAEKDNGVLAQQAQRSKTLREQVQDAPPVTTPLEPSSVATATDPNATNAAAPVERPKPNARAAAEPERESPNYVLPIAIGLIAGIIALIVANRVVSQDI